VKYNNIRINPTVSLKNKTFRYNLLLYNSNNVSHDYSKVSLIRPPSGPTKVV